MMDLKKLFDGVRTLTGKLTQVQVQVIEAILSNSSGLTPEHLAYILATAWGEAKFRPQRENMRYSAKRIREVWPNRPEAVKFANQPRALANSVYGNRLGNRPGTEDGWLYRGGGVDQLTGRDNYRKMGIEGNPDKILQPYFAAKSIVQGMKTGRYTGKKLADYGNGKTFNPRAARAIVNGDVKLNGAIYASYYDVFAKALRDAGWTGVSPAPGAPASAPQDGAEDAQTFRDIAADRPGFLASFLKVILSLFGRRK